MSMNAQAIVRDVSQTVETARSKAIDPTKKAAVLRALDEAEAQLMPRPVDLLKAGEIHDTAALRAEYIQRGLHRVPDTFVLYRIIGNDLVPRHAPGQSRRNVKFALENETDFAGCRKLWVINRIIDLAEKERILELLQRHGQDYIDIPFVAEDYRDVDWDFERLPQPGFLHSPDFLKLKDAVKVRVITAIYRHKNRYVMNNNGARNVALNAGRALGKWIMPWDGNCFITDRAWADIRKSVVERPYLKYFVVPMQRMLSNIPLINEDFIPDPIEEPQLIFRSDAAESFDEDLPYGRRPKVELIRRLRMPGKWDAWKGDPWDVPGLDVSPEAGQFGVAGWVARMFSGVASLEAQGDPVALRNRGLQRQEAIVTNIDQIDGRVLRAGSLGVYRLDLLDQARTAFEIEPSSPLGDLAGQVVAAAEESLQQGPWSVVDKTSVAPSGDIRDYWHPAPYWWPNPDKPDGLPYVKRDGVRVPGTVLNSPASGQYDRSRLQNVFDHATRLALAWRLSGRQDFAAHGARLVRTWFVDEATRMNPSLDYAQVRRGWRKDKGFPAGIIEFKDIYILLDAVRLLQQSGAFTHDDSAVFRAWLEGYMVWLETSEQGVGEASSENNHGSFFDLQTAAIHAYLGNIAELNATLMRAHSRVLIHIDDRGWQAEEMTRPLSQHYVAFNLQGLFSLFRLARNMGHATGAVTTSVRQRLRTGLQWFLRHDMAQWPYLQIKPFDADRLWPLVSAALELGVVEIADLPEAWRPGDLAKVKPVFDYEDAIPPYWNLGL